MMARGASPSREPGSAGRLAVLSGPSGVGKSAVAQRLLKDPKFRRAITATTRSPRKGERDGVDYFFLAREEFERRLRAGWFLEHADVYGNLYGTPKSSVEAVLRAGAHCLLVIDVQGAATLRGAGVEGLYVLLSAPSPVDLERRLRGRGLDSAEEIAKRLSAADAELAQASRFDRVIVNERIEDTAREVASLLGVSLG